MQNPIINDCVLKVATVNGSGSQSSNLIIAKALFRMGIPVGVKNQFPSNIQGLPTWFTIRINKNGYMGNRKDIEIMLAMNQATIAEDIKAVKPNGVFIYNTEIKFDPILLRKDVKNFGIPFRDLVDKVTDSIKIKKLLTNMIYVGVVAELLDIDKKHIHAALSDQLKGKESIIEVNMKAIQAGIDYVKENFKEPFPYKVQPLNLNQNKMLIDGNTASALGMIMGGCTFLSWYPITPSSSIAENFISLANKYRKDQDQKNTAAIIQAEDEIGAIAMVVGAGWSGARAMTCTSGPGVSLMAEFAGLSYFAEIPAVIWDVQRAGPSTGLPTRTQQSDISFATNLSHGDCKHVLLLPGNPKECYDFAQTAFDLSERLQTLVLVMSDLDIGMNLWITDEFTYPTQSFDRGKVLTAEQLTKIQNYGRYKDTDGDGIPYRTLPGTEHPSAPFLTRGSGHNENAQYTESATDYEKLLTRLKLKYDTARTLVPQPMIQDNPKAKIGLISYGSTSAVIQESQDLLLKNGIETAHMRLRSIPFSSEVQNFIKKYDRVYIIEQNRDAQIKELLTLDFTKEALRLHSILNFDGMPIDALSVTEPILQFEKTGKNKFTPSEVQL